MLERQIENTEHKTMKHIGVQHIRETIDTTIELMTKHMVIVQILSNHMAIEPILTKEVAIEHIMTEHIAIELRI